MAERNGFEPGTPCTDPQGASFAVTLLADPSS